jgi:hypothetical protein
MSDTHARQDQTPPTPTPKLTIAELQRRYQLDYIYAEKLQEDLLPFRSHVALVEALEEILEALRVDAPGTPLNNHKYDALGIKARAGLSHAKEKP